MSNNKEPDHPIPDTIVDEGTKTTYVKGRYFGKVQFLIIFSFLSF